MSNRFGAFSAFFALIAVSAFILAPAIPAHADGIMIPPAEIPVRDAFAIRYHRVTVEISDGLVRTRVDQEFENLTGRRIEADYVFPIPHGATLENFAMWVGGEKISGKVLPASEARKIYEDIVRQQRDPALLEYIGNDAFRARVFPIEPGEKKRVELSYTQMIKADNGLYEYVYPLNTEKFSAQMIDSVSVACKIETSAPLKTIYSPTHTISVNRQDDKRATASYEASNVRPDVDFALYYSVDSREIGASLLAYTEDSGEDGFFVATVTPRVQSESAKVIAKNFIFVLDKSGSMLDDDKISQAKDALRFVLRSLNPGDRFNVIAYSDSLWECFKSGMKTWDNKSRDEALDFVNQFEADGGTNINEALLRALEMLKAEGGSKPSYIVFLTDGLPTVGETDESRIISNVSAANKSKARLFSFGVGYDVNTHLLDKLTEANHGMTEYVRPNEDIEVKVSSLYGKISSPVLTDVTISFEGATVRELYPPQMPDLFKGNQIILTGRFKPGAGSATIKLSGKVDGNAKSFSFPVSFASRASYNFVPRIWAGRKIGYLTDEIRLHGINQELIDEIIRLSKRYGIITEYTSFLIREDDMLYAPAEEQLERASKEAQDLAMDVSGAGAVGQSATNQMLKGQAAGGQGNAAAPMAYYNAEGDEVQVTNIKYVGEQTYFLNKGYWTDSRFDPDKMQVTEIKAYSQAYFDLMAQSHELGKYLSLGEQVILVLADGTALKVSTDAGLETLPQDKQEYIGKQIASGGGNRSGGLK
ncbi:MAG: VWA domain-containing protein, partial [bacterium]